MSLSIFSSIPCFVPVKLSTALCPPLFLTFSSELIILGSALISESAAFAKAGFSTSITPLFAFAILTNSPAINPVIPSKSPLSAFIVASTFASLTLAAAGASLTLAVAGFLVHQTVVLVRLTMVAYLLVI